MAIEEALDLLDSSLVRLDLAAVPIACRKLEADAGQRGPPRIVDPRSAQSVPKNVSEFERPLRETPPGLFERRRLPA